MADKAQQLIVDALNRAVAATDGIALFASKGAAGLFATSAAAKKAAQTCKDLGYLQVMRTEVKGKSTAEICAISEKGLAFLVAELSPKQVLEAFVNALEEQRMRVDQLAGTLQASQANFAALKTTAERVLKQIQQSRSPVVTEAAGNGKHTSSMEVLDKLRDWNAATPLGDCPLPELYRGLVDMHPSVSIGQFHDVLRQLYDAELIYLHPWTGPRYEIPEPALALMVGHEIAYYASLRRQ